MQNTDKLIFVGFISSCSGIKGDVAVKSYTQTPEDICKLPLFTSVREKVNLKLIRKNTNGNLICKLNDINNRNDAEKWLKQKLFCVRSALPQIKKDEFYIEDLKNLDVLNLTGERIGIILAVHNFGASDIIEIELTDKETIMLPFTDDFFPQITDRYVVCTKVDKI